MVSATKEVTAKFIVSNVSHSVWGTQITLSPDYLDGRNKEWAAATPAGLIQMTIKNELAADVFQPQQAFTVTFTPGD